MPSTRTPVASGSSVPACPMRRSPSTTRARATTSWLVHPAGLSTTATPCTVAGLRRAIVAPVVEVRVVRVVRVVAEVVEVAEDAFDALRVAHHVVGPELEHWCLPCPELAPERRLQPH